MSHFLKKSVSTEMPGIITDVDAKTGTVKGYFSIFNNKDSDKDIVMPGAFTKTLKEQGKRIRHVWQHDITKPLGRPELTQDSKGLAFTTTISQTSLGKDTILLYEDGVIDEHSFGYNTIKQQRQKDYTELIELRVWEGSSVTLGANEFALGAPSKSMSKEELISRMDRTYKALRNGRYESEEIFEMLDIYHQQLKQLFFDLIVITPAVEETQEPPTEKSEDNEQVINKLNSLTALFN